jgi:hypothetical protein
MNKWIVRLSLGMLLLALVGCAAAPSKKFDYAKFRGENPHSVLIVPVVNHSVNVDAPDYFLSSITLPIAERGYYVFPVNLVKQVMADDGLSDADMVRANDTVKLASLFGADSVLYVSIERWDAKYAVISTTVTVQLNYQLKSGKTGEVLWSNQQTVAYAPQSNNTGNVLGNLVAAAITAAVQKAAPNYMPLAHQANAQAIDLLGYGLPAGPYDVQYGKDLASF